MAELIDILFFFWILVTIATYVLGSLYEKHLSSQREKAEKLKRKQQQQSSLTHDSWSTSNYNNLTTGNSYSYSTQDNYNSNNNNSSSQQQYSAQPATSDYYYSQQPLSSSTTAYLASPKYTTSDTAANYLPDNLNNRPSSPGEDYRQLHQYSDDASYARRRSTQKVDSSDYTIPTATGFNPDCVEWVNEILYLFYTQPHKYGPIITESVYRSLNEKLSFVISSSSEYNQLMVEFTGINRQQSSRPELTNIRTETESDRSVSAVCKIYNKRLQFELSVQKARTSSIANYTNYTATTTGDGLDGQNQEQHYELTLENLEGKLKSVAMLSDRLLVIQFMEKPDTKILLRPKSNYQQTKQLINDDNLVSLILQTLTQVVVDLYFGDDPDFPHYKQPQQQQQQQQQRSSRLNLFKGAGEIKRHLKQDLFGIGNHSAGATSTATDNKERKVFVKIVKARNINYNQSVTCLLEMDQPQQQAVSSTQQGSNPFWDEHFLFNVSDKSTELRLELWDSADRSQVAAGAGEGANKWSRTELTSSGKSLGMVRVNIDELRKEPVQRLNLGLQSSRPDQFGAVSARGLATELSNSVGGELELELLFMEHSSSGGGGGAATAGAGAGVQRNTSASSLINQTDVVSVDRKLTPLGYVITTTTAISKPSANQQRKLQQVSGTAGLSTLTRPASALSSNSERSATSELDRISSAQFSDNQEAGAANAAAQVEPSEGHRSRSRSRSRSFLRAIKKRFSFSRTRSRSLGGNESGRTSRADQSVTGVSSNNNNNLSERQSMISRASSELSLGRAKSVPAQREPSDLPTIVINKGRLSDTASAYAYSSTSEPRSQLVMECQEPCLKADGSTDPQGQLRHYLLTEEQARKWRRRGLKLHVFNEHQFVASHLAGSSTCHLCGRLFSRRPGKQGYKCRNCHLLSHKQCHTKVEHSCPYIAKEALRLEYIDAEPPEALLREEEQRRSAGTLPRQQANKRPARLAAKSISMEATGAEV